MSAEEGGEAGQPVVVGGSGGGGGGAAANAEDQGAAAAGSGDGGGGSGGGGGGGAKNSPRIPHSRSQALAAHGRMLYRASMDEEGLNLPIIVGDDGFIADERINNVVPRKDDIAAKHAWSIPPVDTFQLRGPNYLEDRVKYEANCPPAFECVHVDMVHADGGHLDHVASHPLEYIGKQRKRGNKNFFLVVYFNAAPVHNIIYFELHPRSFAMTQPHLRKTWTRFLEADDVVRNKKFKVIPSIRKGSWMVKKAVGQKPAIIGKALDTMYHYKPNEYFEVDIDVNSSKIARFMMGVVKGAAKDFVIDIGFLIESQEDDELPEMLLGTVRLARPDVKKFSTLPYAPITDSEWKKQQKRANISTKVK